MGSTRIFVRLLGERVDCWRPVDAVEEGQCYRIVGPVPSVDEAWEFQIGELVHCRSRDGDLVAIELVRPEAGQLDLSRPLPLQPGRAGARRQALAEAVARAIDDADPIGLLASGAPADEYAPEIGTILPRIPRANGVDDMVSVLHEEFSRWFGADTAGPRQSYEKVASRIWEAVLEYRYAG